MNICKNLLVGFVSALMSVYSLNVMLSWSPPGEARLDELSVLLAIWFAVNYALLFQESNALVRVRVALTAALAYAVQLFVVSSFIWWSEIIRMNLIDYLPDLLFKLGFITLLFASYAWFVSLIADMNWLGSSTKQEEQE